MLLCYILVLLQRQCTFKIHKEKLNSDTECLYQLVGSPFPFTADYTSTLRNNVRSRAWGAGIGCSFRVERCCIVKVEHFPVF